MTKTYGPFDSGAGASITEDTWRKFMQLMLATGVVAGQLNQHLAFADASGMQVKVQSGMSWIAGHFFQDDAQETIAIAAADPTNPRIDRLVVRADFTANTIDYAILQGTPAASPTAPALTQNTTSRWELPIAQILVTNGVVTIAATKVTDERVFVQNANVPDALRAVNLLSNPGFEVWQRGAGAFTADQAYAADRWQIVLGAASTISVSRNTANREAASQYCAAVTYTHAAESYLRQVLEDYFQLRGKTITFSVRVLASVASALRLALWDDVNGFTYGSYHIGNGAYQTLTVSKTIAATATAVRAFVVFDATGTYYVDNATCVVGSVPVDYYPLHPVDDLARCQRYYEELGGTATNEAIGTGQNTTTTDAVIPIKWQEPKAIAPTITISAAGDFALTQANGALSTVTGLTFSNISRNVATGAATVAAGLVAGNGTILRGNGTTNMRIKIEANP